MKTLGAFKLFEKVPKPKIDDWGAPVFQKRKELGRNGFHFWNQRGRFSLKRLYDRNRRKNNFFGMVYFRHLEFKMTDDAHLGFLETFYMFSIMGLRCYEPIFSLVLIFPTFHLFFIFS